MFCLFFFTVKGVKGTLCVNKPYLLTYLHDHKTPVIELRECYLLQRVLKFPVETEVLSMHHLDTITPRNMLTKSIFSKLESETLHFNKYLYLSLWLCGNKIVCISEFISCIFFLSTRNEILLFWLILL